MQNRDLVTAAAAAHDAYAPLVDAAVAAGCGAARSLAARCADEIANGHDMTESVPLEVIGALAEMAQDLWSALEHPKRRCHLLRALESDRWTAEAIARLESLSEGYHTLNAGHWVHADNPDGLLLLLSQHLRVESGS